MSKKFYLSEDDNVNIACNVTGLTREEILDIVGVFPSDHDKWAGKVKGQVWIGKNSVQIRHHFKASKVLWKGSLASEDSEVLEFKDCRAGAGLESCSGLETNIQLFIRS